MAGAKKLSTRRRRLLYAWRRTRGVLVIAAALAALAGLDAAGLFGRAPAPDVEVYDGGVFRCVRVVDGDTLDIDHPDRRTGRETTRVRLWGVDTPETVKPDTPPGHFGPEASAFTKALAEGLDVRLELDTRTGKQRDKYDRLLAYVHLPDGRMLNRVLVAEGYGYADPRFEHLFGLEFRHLGDRARRKRLGLWAEARPGDLPEYLRRRR